MFLFSLNINMLFSLAGLSMGHRFSRGTWSPEDMGVGDFDLLELISRQIFFIACCVSLNP